MWSVFGIFLLFSFESPTHFLLFIATLFTFVGGKEGTCLAGYSGSLEAPLRVDDFDEEFACLFLLDGAEFS